MSSDNVIKLVLGGLGFDVSALPVGMTATPGWSIDSGESYADLILRIFLYHSYVPYFRGLQIRHFTIYSMSAGYAHGVAHPIDALAYGDNERPTTLLMSGGGAISQFVSVGTATIERLLLERSSPHVAAGTALGRVIEGTVRAWAQAAPHCGAEIGDTFRIDGGGLRRVNGLRLEYRNGRWVQTIEAN